jgi:hypothetical protein
MGQTHSVEGMFHSHDTSDSGQCGAVTSGPRLARRLLRRQPRQSAGRKGAHTAAPEALLAPRTASEAERTAAFVGSLALADCPAPPELENVLTLMTGIFGARTAALALFDEKRVRRAGCCTPGPSNHGRCQRARIPGELWTQEARRGRLSFHCKVRPPRNVNPLHQSRLCCFVPAAPLPAPPPLS